MLYETAKWTLLAAPLAVVFTLLVARRYDARYYTVPEKAGAPWDEKKLARATRIQNACVTVILTVSAAALLALIALVR